MAIRILFGIFILWMTNYNSAKGSTLEERMEMSTMELIADDGYKGEEFEVETEDHYILKIQKVTYDSTKNDSANPQKREENNDLVVYLQHGFGCDSSTWVISRENSLAYILARAGFIVYMGNLRGNVNSRHKYYPKWYPGFYDFTWDDHALKDLPALWKFVLNNSGQKKIFSVGLSLGVWTTLANFALSKEFQDKFFAFFATGPVSRLTYTTKEEYRLLGKALLPLNIVQPALLLPYHNTYADMTHCEPNCTETKKLYNKHCNSGTSFKAGLHGLQLTKSTEFSQFDNYYTRNFLSLKPSEPLVYDLTNIDVPVYLYSAPNDDLADPIDVSRLEDDLPNVRNHSVLNDNVFLHNDFVVGKYVHELVYYPIVEEMKKLRDEMKKNK